LIQRITLFPIIIRIHFGPDYPYKSPSVGILNKIYHPNVDWGSGSVCFNALNHDWKECYTLYQMMTTLLPFLLRTPNGSDPLNQEAGLLCEKCPEQYKLHVKEMVSKYALLHQFEPILKGSFDWRTKQLFDINQSSLKPDKKQSPSSTSPLQPFSSSSQQPQSPNSHKAEKACNVQPRTSNTGKNKASMDMGYDSDGIDDNALLDSSDSEREENKNKNNKKESSTSLLTTNSNSGSEKDKKLEFTNDSLHPSMEGDESSTQFVENASGNNAKTSTIERRKKRR